MNTNTNTDSRNYLTYVSSEDVTYCSCAACQERGYCFGCDCGLCA